MTKPTKPESAASQMKRLDHAIELEETLILKDELEAIVKSENPKQKGPVR